MRNFIIFVALPIPGGLVFNSTEYQHHLPTFPDMAAVLAYAKTKYPGCAVTGMIEITHAAPTTQREEAIIEADRLGHDIETAMIASYANRLTTLAAAEGKWKIV